jgi:RNA polymerase sigma factor (TIGR02999 family)
MEMSSILEKTPVLPYDIILKSIKSEFSAIRLKPSMGDVTRILSAIERGNTKAVNDLLPLVYEELRCLAAQKMSQEAPGQTLQPTALVHEAYIRLVGSESRNWKGRTHFVRAAAEAMRRILIDTARRKKASNTAAAIGESISKILLFPATMMRSRMT